MRIEGRHIGDIAHLRFLDELGLGYLTLNLGDTVIVIEHNLDLIAAADCGIDLGPERGRPGGRVAA